MTSIAKNYLTIHADRDYDWDVRALLFLPARGSRVCGAFV